MYDSFSLCKSLQIRSNAYVVIANVDGTSQFKNSYYQNVSFF